MSAEGDDYWLSAFESGVGFWGIRVWTLENLQNRCCKQSMIWRIPVEVEPSRMCELLVDVLGFDGERLVKLVDLPSYGKPRRLVWHKRM